MKTAKTRELTLTDDEWTAQYRPLTAQDGSDSLTWEYDDTVPFDYHQVWSYMDGDAGGTFIANGYHVVNVYAYAVTEKPWAEGDAITVVIESAEEERARHESEGSR